MHKHLCQLAIGLALCGCTPRQSAEPPATPTSAEPTIAPEPEPPAPPTPAAVHLWLGVRIGPYVYALVEDLGERGPPPESAEELGPVVNDGREELMHFFASPTEPSGQPDSVTVLSTGQGAPCVAEPRRFVRLTSHCLDHRDEPWHGQWTALEIDCQTPSWRSIVASGAHPAATLSRAALEEGGVMIAELDEGEPPDWGVFLEGSRIGAIRDPAYPQHAQLLRVANVPYLIVPSGAHGYGLSVISAAPGPIREAIVHWYPAVTCGAN